MTLQFTFFAPGEGRPGFDLLHFGSRPGDFLDDLLHRGRPDEGLGVFVPGCQKLIDRSLQVRYAQKATSSDCLGCQFPEPALDQVQPARAGWDEVANKARMLLQPSLHVRLCMRSIVVHDQMKLQSRGKFPIQAAQESQPLLMAMPGVAFTDDLAVEDVERCKQRRGAVAFVVVCHRTAASFLQRQPRLSAIKRESRPRESHPKPLAELYVTLSRHTAPIVRTVTLPKASQWMNNRGCRLTIFFSQRWLRRGCCASLRYFRRAQLRSL